MFASPPAEGREPTANPPCSTNAAPPAVDESVPRGADRWTLALGMGCFLLLASILLVEMIKGLLSR